ncbi:MAG: stage II sporulation protein P [Ruminococcus sp.]|nr:stage II sporulation protein P [Ruminococcus sp.]
MLSCSAVPMLISGGYGYVPNFSDRIVYSAARELSWDPELDAKSAAAPIRSIKVSTGAADLMAAPEEIEVHRPEGIEIPTPLPSQQVLDAIPYPDDLTDHDGSIEKTNFGSYTGEQYFDLRDGGQVRNCTWHTNEELLEASTMGRVFDIETGTDEPQILIYHTHTTECFELEDKDWYDSDFGAKTTEADKNITAVGNEICKQLEASGISVIHDTLVHDYPSYDAAYDSSRETVSELLEQYPSIRIALDIHRDGIETAEGVRLAPTAEINGKDAAQIMIISGCDDGTFGMPDYINNFRFACELQSRTETMFEGLTRPILFDYRFYNQDLTDGSLLIEVGSHGNTLDQAKYSGELIGKALAALLCE